MVKDPKYGLAGMLLAAGLSIFSGGCAEMTDSDLAALGLLGYSSGARTPRQAQSAAALSRYASQSGRRQHELNAARNVGALRTVDDPSSKYYQFYEITNLDTGKVMFYNADDRNELIEFTLNHLPVYQGGMPEKGYKIYSPKEQKIFTLTPVDSLEELSK
jgi:hypothetical protein